MSQASCAKAASRNLLELFWNLLRTCFPEAGNDIGASENRFLAGSAPGSE
jgi:hypothetical protein